ncbi:MAG: hypothetical protein AUK35_04575 [Zetaproteobacteria bacterium CG2_30_46_52]|nr:MAG: hypothetical protein AUK35_04575 [Zetaproteobacteria bacterium CG2_30_46_52]
MTKHVIVVGGGIAGLTAALRLAERGFAVDVYDAAPELGGRTKSHFDEGLQVWVDNGPHLMVGAYEATQKLMADVGASDLASWQHHLTLPLWHQQRGFFALEAKPYLPIALALLVAVAKLPGHGYKSVLAMLKIALGMHKRNETQTVAAWMEEVKAPDLLKQDMLEVLCLGVMNEPMLTANAKTFARVLATSFASHNFAKMGWFNKPLSQALVAPVVNACEKQGVRFYSRQTIRDISELKADAVVLALPATARNRLLGIDAPVETMAITNIHFWLEEPIEMSNMMVGMLGTYSQWLFDVSAMTHESGQLQHLCVTVSADVSDMRQEEMMNKAWSEIEVMVGRPLQMPLKSRLIREKRATTLVRPFGSIDLPSHFIDAGESPFPGQLPATIELAVISGEKAAAAVTNITREKP